MASVVCGPTVALIHPSGMSVERLRPRSKPFSWERERKRVRVCGLGLQTWSHDSRERRRESHNTHTTESKSKAFSQPACELLPVAC